MSIQKLKILIILNGFVEILFIIVILNRHISVVVKDPATLLVLFVPQERMDTSALPQYDAKRCLLLFF